VPELRATILLEVDGVALPDMPIIRRYVVAELSGLVAISQPPDNNSTSYHPIQAITMPNLGVFLLTTDQAQNLKINLNTPVPFNADGLILILGANLTQGTPNQNIEVNNPAVLSAVNANLGVLAGGT
jgi:hypothetical protein